MLHGILPRIRIFLRIGFSVCLPHPTALYGLAPEMDWRVGRTASSRSTRKPRDCTFSKSSKIEKEAYGPVALRLLLESSARFVMAAFSAQVTTALLAAAHSVCMRTAKAISGQA